ncbi:MAG: xanthine dehydrogenase family protein subunit M [Haloferacaceae archaeon]
MFPKDTEVLRADSLGHAAELLREHGPDARVLAGGQSLVPMMKFRLAAPPTLIDVSSIPSPGVRLEDDRAVLPALTTHAEAIDHDELTDTFDLVDDAIPQIADPQVRNMGTVGGSLGQADPSGDWGPVCMALSGRIHTVSPDGERDLSADDLFDGTLSTTLANDELIERVTLPLPDPAHEVGGAYLKVKRRQGVYATASVGVHLVFDGDEVVDAGAVVNSVGPDYHHDTEVEAALEGSVLTDERIREAADLLLSNLEVLADTRGSETYKRDVVRALFKRAAKTAQDRAQGQDVATDPLAQMGAI